MKTVMIVAGETSGDLYGSLLAKALKGKWSDIRLVGIGGEKMTAAGVEIVAGISSALGLTEVLSSIKKIRQAFNAAKKALKDARPDVIVLIDYPDFNFRLGNVAKKQGIKVLYYVSPQVWAWRKGRVKTMSEFVDRMAVILPFEEEIYRKAGISCEFVGHPVMEEIGQYEEGMQHKDSGSRNPTILKKTVIALLPGSRPNELKTLLPVFRDTVKLLKKEWSGCKIILPLAPNIDRKTFEEHLDSLENEGVEILDGRTIDALLSSDAAVIASGTATLQAALLTAPMVVVYKLSLLTYLLGKAILKVRHISLVNILARRQIVSELIQQKANAAEIMKELKKLLQDGDYRYNIISSLKGIRGIFSGRRPSQRVAEMIGELAGWRI